jgi:hypothetical protein
MTLNGHITDNNTVNPLIKEALKITTLSIMGLIETSSINDTRQNDPQHNGLYF